MYRNAPAKKLAAAVAVAVILAVRALAVVPVKTVAVVAVAAILVAMAFAVLPVKTVAAIAVAVTSAAMAFAVVQGRLVVTAFVVIIAVTTKYVVILAKTVVRIQVLIAVDPMKLAVTALAVALMKPVVRVIVVTLTIVKRASRACAKYAVVTRASAVTMERVSLNVQILGNVITANYRVAHIRFARPFRTLLRVSATGQRI